MTAVKCSILKYLFLLVATIVFLQACSNGNGGGKKDSPAAIEDSLQLTNDSIVSADDVPNNGLEAGGSDSTERN
jgi:hypothetical protein